VKISEHEVRYIADLANLELTGDEVRRSLNELNDILAHMDKLNELDTSAVEPMAQVLYEAEATATLREDVEGLSLSNAEATGNAAAAGGGYFKVPKVIER
jgi:aspartyl-tRNA(Asn)/glutamyl-tRNA(Gln) amidotransferase subunit C